MQNVQIQSYVTVLNKENNSWQFKFYRRLYSTSLKFPVPLETSVHLFWLNQFLAHSAKLKQPQFKFKLWYSF